MNYVYVQMKSCVGITFQREKRYKYTLPKNYFCFKILINSLRLLEICRFNIASETVSKLIFFAISMFNLKETWKLKIRPLFSVTVKISKLGGKVIYFFASSFDMK